MSSAFNADDNNIPFFGLRVRPQAELCFVRTIRKGTYPAVLTMASQPRCRAGGV